MTKGFLIQEWEAQQNLFDDHATTNAYNTEWASRCINAIWIFSKQLWEGRCSLIHSPDSTTKISLKTKEIRQVLREELEWLKTSKNYDDKQLTTNIERHMEKALDKTMYKWLVSIRSRKEAEAQRKSHDCIRNPRARSITTFFRSGCRT